VTVSDYEEVGVGTSERNSTGTAWSELWSLLYSYYNCATSDCV